jgi:DNA-binding transcriptional MerR regulator
MAKRYRSAEVCRLLDLQPYVLRYWATEFPSLGVAADGAHSTYGEEEVAQLRRIKQLLYEEGYTIAGARKKLESEPVVVEPRAGGALRGAESAAVDTSGADGDATLAPAAPGAARAAAAFELEGEPSEARGAERARRAPSRSATRLDTSDDEQIEQLRRGIAAALDEARDLLALLARDR